MSTWRLVPTPNRARCAAIFFYDVGHFDDGYQRLVDLDPFTANGIIVLRLLAAADRWLGKLPLWPWLLGLGIALSERFAWTSIGNFKWLSTAQSSGAGGGS